MRNGFLLTSDECELLIHFETASSLERLASSVGRDTSNVSRALNRIAGKLPVIEKQGNRWVLTELGRQMNQHARDSIQFQQSLSQKQSWLRIGSNREFSSRILAVHLNKLNELFPGSKLRISAFESGTEQALLEGQIDIGIDCDRPFSPEISYRLAVKEPIVAVCSPEFKKTHAKAIKDGTFFGLPHLLCDRLLPDRILSHSENNLNVHASFNDIASTRAACVAGLGWALLPTYAISSELDARTLVEIPSVGGGESSYGVWWPRARKYLEPSAQKLREWLKTVEL